MEIPTTNFFEVTINTNKLYSFIFDIKKQIQTQEKKTDELLKSFGGIVTLRSQFQKMQSEMSIELQKIRRSAQQQNNYLRLYMKDVDKKTGEKIEQLEKSNAMLSSKINTVREELQEDQCVKLSYLEKKIQNKMELEEMESKISQEVLKMKQSIDKIQQKQEKINYSLENDIKKNVQFSENLIYKQAPIGAQAKNSTQRCSQEKNQSKSRSKKTLKAQKVNTLNSEQSNNQGGKIEEFCQNTYTQCNIAHQAISFKDKSEKNRAFSQKKITKSFQNQAKQRQFQKNVNTRLESIQKRAGQSFVDLQKQMLKLNNKYEIVDEYIGILTRKLQKEKTRFDDVNQAIKRFQEKKIDERTIENLRNNMKKISKDYQNGLQLKLNKEVYDQQFYKLSGRVQNLSEMVTEKAQKSEVKKWFTFVQEKMKEIIVVLAEERSITNDGAAKRLPFKCLSCDKELEVQNQEQSMNVSNSTNIRMYRDKNNNIRNSATQLRKKMRISNHLNSSQN